jgi:hypothetical protein
MIPGTVPSGNVRRQFVVPSAQEHPARLGPVAPFAEFSPKMRNNIGNIVVTLLLGVVVATGATGCDVKVRDDGEDDGASGATGAPAGTDLEPGSPGSWKTACSAREDCLEENAACIASTATPTGGICTGPLAKRAYLAECTPYVEGGGDVCSGFACQGLPPNPQGKAGICTLAGCIRDADCGVGAICYAQGVTTLCLATCSTSDDCAGFACVSASPTTNVCLVQTQ